MFKVGELEYHRLCRDLRNTLSREYIFTSIIFRQIALEFEFSLPLEIAKASEMLIFFLENYWSLLFGFSFSIYKRFI